MSLKAFVNSPDVHAAFIAYINGKISVLQTSLEQVTDTASIYRFQGQIIALRKLLNIREEVNYKDKSHG